eukprot:31197-Pelagococcus_subviridis.AAC.3
MTPHTTYPDSPPKTHSATAAACARRPHTTHRFAPKRHESRCANGDATRTPAGSAEKTTPTRNGGSPARRKSFPRNGNGTDVDAVLTTDAKQNTPMTPRCFDKISHDDVGRVSSSSSRDVGRVSSSSSSSREMLTRRARSSERSESESFHGSRGRRSSRSRSRRDIPRAL